MKNKTYIMLLLEFHLVTICFLNVKYKIFTWVESFFLIGNVSKACCHWKAIIATSSVAMGD
jgi:hypothetical protein